MIGSTCELQTVWTGSITWYDFSPLLLIYLLIVYFTLIHFQFFGLFGLSNRASSMIGPNVIQAIIDKSNGNNGYGFPFLFALCVAASIVIWFGVDVEKGRRDAGKWAYAKRSHDTAVGVQNLGMEKEK